MKDARFDSYFLMGEADVPAYVKARLDFFSDEEELDAKEIGDGVVGQARAPDITSIPDIKRRLGAEKILITAATHFILKAGHFRTGKDFLKNFFTAVEQYS
jgi:5-methylthioribose kinase